MPTQRQGRRLTTKELPRAMGMLECWSSQRKVGCQRLWCEPNCDKHSMESLPDVWLSYSAHDGGRQRAAKTGPIYCGARQTSSLRECDYSTK